jgi:hemin uptake protein HemP
MNKSPTLIKSKTAQTDVQDESAKPVNLKRLCSIELFAGARELVIEHAGDEYRLRQTNQGKLILTK